MQAFINVCRRMAVAASMIVLGAVIAPMLATGSAQADSTYQFRAEGASSASGRQNSRGSYGRSKPMRLGAIPARRHRENLSGGSPAFPRGVVAAGVTAIAIVIDAPEVCAPPASATAFRPL